MPGYWARWSTRRDAAGRGWGSRSSRSGVLSHVAAPNIPAPVLRGLARFAGVHLYSEAGDVLYATPELLSVHTVAGGRRSFSLPRKVERVYDLFNQIELGRDVERIDTVLPPRSTTLYYTGAAEILAGLTTAA